MTADLRRFARIKVKGFTVHPERVAPLRQAQGNRGSGQAASSVHPEREAPLRQAQGKRLYPFILSAQHPFDRLRAIGSGQAKGDMFFTTPDSFAIIIIERLKFTQDQINQKFKELTQ